MVGTIPPPSMQASHAMSSFDRTVGGCSFRCEACDHRHPHVRRSWISLRTSLWRPPYRGKSDAAL